MYWTAELTSPWEPKRNSFAAFVLLLGLFTRTSGLGIAGGRRGQWAAWESTGAREHVGGMLDLIVTRPREPSTW